MKGRYDCVKQFYGDLQEGVPIYMVLPRHRDVVNVFLNDDTQRADWMRMLKRRGVKPFQHLQENPLFGELALPVEPIAWNAVEWNEGTSRGIGSDSSLTFALPRPMFVAGIR